MRFLLLAVTFLTSVSFAAPKDTLQIGTHTEFENLHPLIAQQAATTWILYMAHRRPFALNPEGQWYSPIFKNVPTIENKLAKVKNGMLETTLEVIENAKWGDGTPVTCKDLELGWRIGRSENVSVPEREPFETVSDIKVDAANPKKCVVTMKRVVYNYLNMYPDLVPEHLESKIFEEQKSKPQGYDHNSLYTKQPSNPGLWFGPYVVTEVKLGSHIVFSQNPHFHGKKPYFKKIVMKLLPNTNTHVSNLKSGNIDMLNSPGGLGLDQASAFDKEVKRDGLPYSVVFADGIVYSHIDFNLDNPILQDIRVRRAIAHSLDKKEISETLLEGRARPAIANVPASSPWYDPKLKTYAFDKKLAVKLLDEAGWKLGPDGIRVKDGKRLTLQLMSLSGVKLTDLILTYVQAQLKSVGIEASIKVEPARVFFGETLKKRGTDLPFYSWSSQPESSPRSQLHSTSIPTEANAWSGQNIPGYKNPEVDKLIDQLETELNDVKRAKIAKKILAHYVEDIPVLPIYFRSVNSVVPKDLKGFKLSGHLFYETLAVENWHY